MARGVVAAVGTSNTQQLNLRNQLSRRHLHPLKLLKLV
jgi:hypothetical protein